VRFGKDGRWPPPDDEYQVGYRKPPQHSRFKPGQSGNRRGKPPGAKNALTLLKQALLSSVLVKQDGHETKTTKLRAIVMRLVTRAMQGDYASIRLLLQYGLERELKEASVQHPGHGDEIIKAIRRVLVGSDEPAISDNGDKQPENAIADCSAEQPESAPASPSSVSNQRLGYQIGYGKPPLHSRFQKGRSGNPAGRPRVPQDLRALILRLLDEEVSLTENGQKRKVSRRHAIFTQIVHKALMGDVRFQVLLLQYVTITDLTLRPSHFSPKKFEEYLRRLQSKDF